MIKKITSHKYFPYLLIAVVSLFYLLPLFKPGFFISHDGEDHIVRIGAMYKAITDGQIPPTWTGDLNFRYGAPIFIFYYPFPAYIGTLFYEIVGNLTTAFKSVLVLSFLLAPITFYVWIKNIVSKPAAIISSLLYGLAPYHFLNLYVRSDIGELTSFVFIPLVFLAIDRVKDTKERFFFLGVVSYALLILSHNAVSLIFSVIFAFYILFSVKNIKQFITSSSILLFGLLLSAYFWLPALYERKFVNNTLFEDFYTNHFLSLGNIIYSSWGFGADINKSGGLSAQLGIVAPVVIVASIAAYKKMPSKYIFWLITFFVSLFITTQYSQLLWSHIPLLSLFQFPWRFLAVSSFALAVVGSYFLNITTKFNQLLILSALLLISSMFVKTQPPVHYDDSYYLSFPGTTFYHAEATTIWTEGNWHTIPNKPIEIIGGEGKITNIDRKNHIHRFTIESRTDVQVKDNTQYFPGWKVMADGKEVPIEFQDMNHRGIITFRLPAGKHNVSVVFTNTKDRILGNIISVSTLVLLLIIYITKIDKRLLKKYA